MQGIVNGIDYSSYDPEPDDAKLEVHLLGLGQTKLLQKVLQEREHHSRIQEHLQHRKLQHVLNLPAVHGREHGLRYRCGNGQPCSEQHVRREHMLYQRVVLASHRTERNAAQ